MKALSAIEKIKVDSFASNYLGREYENCLSIGRQKKIKITMLGNILYRYLFFYFYSCTIGRLTLIIFSNFQNIFIIARKCLNHPDWICFVCGKFTSKEQQRNITYDIKKMNMIHFGCSLVDQDKTCAPHKKCKKCRLGLHN